MSIIHQTSIDQFDYEVELWNNEFTVVESLWRGGKRQLGETVVADRPLCEYTAHDYEQFVRDALATEN